MDSEESLHRFGLRPLGADLDLVRALLAEHTALERAAQGTGDTELMKLCCVQLFNSGTVEDALLVWAARGASFDAGCSIEAELLLGRGLDATTAHLAAVPEPSAAAALAHLRKLDAAGHLAGFEADEHAARYDDYYAD
ncbi:hypothetical protein [Kitasatospora cheerisanensis]|uniref:Uncharacterized protein n=1 Tax=Kitasatospora cheerisanensis KCTC 2395 TaxID=1348663 RepID=A0A066YJT3_9ACTN|nr:hypothetical protein [Kitasatospora cheerisanensis]KDN81713.1 hypothetical protein KCH_64330 [Kitasatospora cheerisanensis KCTC 2395]